ncbi:OsmC family protein [Niabella drilacis]|uniref:Organic hydroperoxide reductase OsmC/OhrA n=1 Tax=Niabella drilacis (strain DSM 25811 / CCM 8410 / CCUG 62505 / LMG 26954 / E90) TaxID=1285928 RepID=A0A1G6RCC1_NIADE|nr:OsmC family protein [Niabella drilacis]SDD01556.1 Organic hydroperoxide reductase OsmC/OhrA [Niabella drilacis]
MLQEHFYEVDLEWESGRRGLLSSPVLGETIACATPPEFPNGVPGIWSPEHLYAAAINSCYMATFLAIAENFRLAFSRFSCKTICKLEQKEGRYQITEAVIDPVVTLQNYETDQQKALRVLEKSKSACLVTNSIKTTIGLNVTLM